MKNPILRAYEIFDNALMTGAGAVFRTYNWVTGDTKRGLANKLLMISPLFHAAGSYEAHKDMSSSLLSSSTLMAFNYLLWRPRNNKIESLEREALDKNMLNYYVEVNKKSTYPFMGGLFVFGSSVHFLSAWQNQEHSSFRGDIGMGIGGYLSALSFYTMRLEDLPPRKDCISRGIDKIKDAVQNYRAKETLVPQLARNRYYLDDLLGGVE